MSVESRRRIALITGGSGFFGAHLARLLLQHDYEVRVLDLRDLEDAGLKRTVRFFRGDVLDSAVVDLAVAGARHVFHIAAALPICRDRKALFRTNVQGTRTVLETAWRRGVEKVVHISSSAVYLGEDSSMPINESTPPSPVGDYGKSKLEAERICAEFRRKGLALNILRPRTLVGAGRLGIFQILFDWILKGKRVYTLGRGDNLFQLLSPEDLARACLLAVTSPGARSEDFCLGTDRFATVAEDLTALLRYAHTASRLYPLPVALSSTVLSLLDTLNLSPLTDWHYKTPHKHFYFDITKARDVLGFVPTDSNAEMLIKSYAWYVANYKNCARRYGTTHRDSVRQRLLSLLSAVS